MSIYSLSLNLASLKESYVFSFLSSSTSLSELYCAFKGSNEFKICDGVLFYLDMVALLRNKDLSFSWTGILYGSMSSN